MGSLNKVRVGTRGSKLALAQAKPMVDFLRGQGLEIDWREFTTSGDKWLAGPLDERGGSGFFTKELEDALLDGEVDLLIHSLKDVALDRPAGIVPACFPLREDPRDILVLRSEFEGGFTSAVRGVFCYRVDDDGLITNMRGYWNLEGMQFGQSTTGR